MTSRLQTPSSSSYNIPPETLSAFGSYPNPLDITDADRARFHPVVIFPRSATPLPVIDFTAPRPNAVELATEEQRQASAVAVANDPNNGYYASLDFLPQSVRDRLLIRGNANRKNDGDGDGDEYFIGRYDENRVGLYVSEMFDDTANAIEDFSGRRTLHVGMDLDGPVYTPVHAFCKGKVHAVGKNTALGDYGNVIIVEHELPAVASSETSSPSQQPRLLYALYGHLDDSVPRRFAKGDAIAAGQCLGRFGAIHENGGWFIPHVHFQLSVKPPVTHDLPGVVAMADRARALVEYPDPRLVLGELY